MSCQLDTCCGCVKLKTGCFIIGYLSLVGDIIATILSIVDLTSINAVLDALGPSNSTDVKELKGVLNTVLAIVGILLFFIIVSLAFTATLLVGLHKDKRGNIKAYLIYAAIFIAINVIILIVRHVMVPIVGIDSIFSIIKILLSIYFLVVIRSHYINLGEVKERAVYTTS